MGEKLWLNLNHRDQIQLISTYGSENIGSLHSSFIDYTEVESTLVHT